jgi:hypothetical protein
MLQQALLNMAISVLSGILGSFIGFACWPWLRRRRIRKDLRVVAEPYTGTEGFWCRVVNGSPFSMGKAVAYMTIDHKVEDMLDPPARRDAYLNPKNGFILREGQLCWGVQEGGVNPMRVDIYSGEKQPLIFGFIENNRIEIVSEKLRSPARVFLARKAYTGTLKVVCMDCPAKEFRFKLDPDSDEPIQFSF